MSRRAALLGMLAMLVFFLGPIRAAAQSDGITGESWVDIGQGQVVMTCETDASNIVPDDYQDAVAYCDFSYPSNSWISHDCDGGADTEDPGDMICTDTFTVVPGETYRITWDDHGLDLLSYEEDGDTYYEDPDNYACREIDGPYEGEFTIPYWYYMSSACVGDPSSRAWVLETVNNDTTIAISPPGKGDVAPSQTVDFSVNNDFNAKWTVPTGASTGAIISGDGTNSATFQAPADSSKGGGMTATVKACEIGNSENCNSVTVTMPALTVSVNVASDNLDEKQSRTYDATVGNDMNNAGVTWSVSPGYGAISPNGLSVTYVAPSGVGSVSDVVKATSNADNTEHASITVYTIPIAVAVTPPTVTLSDGGTQQFTATVQNDLGQQGVTWSYSPQVGTLSNTGYYKAPDYVNSEVPITVYATCNDDHSKVGTAQLTLKPPPVRIQFFQQNVQSPVAIYAGDLVELNIWTPSGAVPVNQLWAVNGSAIASYSGNNASGGPSPLTGLANSALTFYWTDAGANGLSQYTVSYTCLDSNVCPNGNATASLTFTVTGPSGYGVANNVSVQMGDVFAVPIQRGNNPLTPRMILWGIGPPPGNNAANQPGGEVGIIVTANGTLPANPGNYSWVQVLSKNVNEAINANSQRGTCSGSFSGPGNELDTCYQYEICNPIAIFTNRATYDTFTDAPGWTLNSANAEQYSSFNATLYLMWVPPLSAPCTGATAADGNACNIPVPLGYVNWYFVGDAINTLKLGGQCVNVNNVYTCTTWTIQPDPNATSGGCGFPSTNCATHGQQYTPVFVPSRGSTAYPSWSGVFVPNSVNCNNVN
jgi:hypothetical protein